MGFIPNPFNLVEDYNTIKNAINPAFDLPFLQEGPNQGAIPILQNSFPKPSSSQPTKSSTNTSGTTNTGTTDSGAVNGVYGSSGGSGYSAPIVNQATIDGFNQAIGTDNAALGRLPGQLGIAQGNINSQFTQKQNELNSTKDQSQNSYNTGTNQNQQSFRTNKNQIADQASAGLSGLLRTLGAYGAGGSSEALYNAPQAVAGQASQQRAGAGQNYASNQSGLDTNWNNFLSQDKNERAKLTDWQTQNLNSAQAQSETTKQSLLSHLADLMGKKAEAQGGSYTGAAQPFIDQANALSGQIDQLGALHPTYTGTTPVYSAPSLSSYQVADHGSPTVQTNALTSTTSPSYLSLLMGQQKDKTATPFNPVGA